MEIRRVTEQGSQSLHEFYRGLQGANADDSIYRAMLQLLQFLEDKVEHPLMWG